MDLPVIYCTKCNKPMSTDGGYYAFCVPCNVTAKTRHDLITSELATTKLPEVEKVF